MTLPAGGAPAPITDSDPTGTAQYGPAILFTSGPLTVSTQGTTGPGGSVISSSNIQTVNTSEQEVFTADSVSSTCAASGSGSGGSTTITNGTLQTSEGDPDVDGDETIVSIPTNPAPNTTYAGTLEGIGDTFSYVFNEQIVNPDGSITVNAAHEYLLGPTAVGELIIGRSACGVTGSVVGETDPPETTIDSGPSGTTSSTSLSFTFSSSETGSTFECKLDGPGTATDSFGACSSPKNYANLADGGYAFSVRATDNAHNTDATPAAGTFTVDTAPADQTAPETTITKKKIKQAKRTAKFSFSSSEADSSFLCRLDKKAFGSCTSPKGYKRLKPGKHKFLVQATDGAGNKDPSPAAKKFKIKKKK